MRALPENDLSPAPGLLRRGFLQATAGLATGLMLPGGRASAAPTASAERRRVLRLAHLTDIHVQPENDAEAGMTACLRHVHDQADAPELILFGGDSIMDAFAQTLERSEIQWEIWHRVLERECSLPWKTCIGNHDIRGWKGGGFEPTADGTDEGKRHAIERLGLSERYYSFDQAGWKFLVLDSTHPGAKPGSYTARLDDEQFDWLSRQLAETPAGTPVLVLSHIPILGACPFLDGDNETSGDWIVPGAWMHIDARKISALFHERGNVRACLSGHIHLVDQVDYLGTRYYCDGAVSGGWWRGPYQQFGPGYALIDLYDDGSTTREFVSYGGKS